MTPDDGSSAGLLRRATSPFILALVCLLPLLAALPTLGLGDDVEAARPGWENLGWLPPLSSWMWMQLLIGIPALLSALLLPGIFLALGAGRSLRADEVLLEGFLWSFCLVSGVAAAADAAIGRAVTGIEFLALVTGITIAAAIWFRRRTLAGRACSFLDPDFGLQAPLNHILRACVPLIILVILFPKIFIECFNGDGAHVYEASRLLLHRPLPFWADNPGAIGSYPGLNAAAFAWPASWFMRTIGPCEAAVRLPILLYVVLLHAGLSLFARRTGRLTNLTSTGLWGSILCILVVAAFCMTYDPYGADLAGLAAPDLLFTAWMFHLLALQDSNRPVTRFLVTVLFLTSSAGALPALGLLFICRFVIQSDGRLRRAYSDGFTLIAAVALLMGAEKTLQATGLAWFGGEHDPLAMLRRFRYIYVLGLERFLWVLVPGGLFAIAAFHRLRLASAGFRCVAGFTAAQFFLYYFMLGTNLHYFTPVMFLVPALFWQRWEMEDAFRARWRLAVIPGFLITLFLIVPRHPGIAEVGREIGARFHVGRIPGYEESSPEFFASTENAGSLFFPDGSSEGVPESRYGGSFLVWNYYARRCSGQRNYLILRRAAAASAPGTSLSSADENVQARVIDPQLWQKDQESSIPSALGPSLFVPDRALLFRSREAQQKAGLIDLALLLEKLGLRRHH